MPQRPLRGQTRPQQGRARSRLAVFGRVLDLIMDGQNGHTGRMAAHRDTQTEILAHLDRVIETRGHGGVFSVAVDLGADASHVSKWRLGKRPVPARFVKPIMGLIPELHHPNGPNGPERPADGPNGPEAPQPLPRGLDALEQEVIKSRPATIYTFPGAGHDDEDWPEDWPQNWPEDGAPAPKLDPGSFRDQVWLPGHDFIAMIKGPPAGPVITQMARSDQGKAACEAAHRSADRLGLTNILANGHWTADLATLGFYAWAMLMAIRAAGNGPDPDMDPDMGGPEDEAMAA